MKQFLYLDTDIVTSIIAQAEKGYITQQTSESGVQKHQSNEVTGSFAGEAEVSGGFLKVFQAGLKISGASETHGSNASQSSTKEIAEKILHDAAFDVAYGYIKPAIVAYGNQEKDEEGNYLEIRRVFDFVDFDYLEGLFAKDGVIEYLKRTSSEQLKGTSSQQIKDLAAMIKAFRGLVPYTRILISHDGYLIPVDDKYFRIDPSSMGFKYGGEMTCVGLVTNIIGESTDPEETNNFFATLQYKANEALTKLLPTSKGDLCVVHPIAVYYGQ